MESHEKSNNINTSEVFKKGFFKKVCYCITKIEKYPEMATEGIGKACSYLFKLVAILAIVLSIWMTYQTYELMNLGLDYIKNQFPEFLYKDGVLQVESQEAIVIEGDDTPLGKVIVDTNTDSQEKVNEYINSIVNSQSGIIILKDRMIIQNASLSGSLITYNYKQTFEQMQITEFNKSNLIEYVNSSQMISVYISVLFTMFIYTFIMYLLTTLWYILSISVIGYLTAVILKIRMRYVAIFNMSVYAITLSVLLNVLYLIINMIVPFTIQYFQVMYISVATIYLIAAIFIIKSEFIKKQAELMKIAEAQAIIKKEMKNDNEDKNKENEKKDKKDEEDKRKKDKDNEEEPEGLEA